jgi:hypothetical protein
MDKRLEVCTSFPKPGPQNRGTRKRRTDVKVWKWVFLFPHSGVVRERRRKSAVCGEDGLNRLDTGYLESLVLHRTSKRARKCGPFEFWHVNENPTAMGGVLCESVFCGALTPCLNRLGSRLCRATGLACSLRRDGFDLTAKGSIVHHGLLNDHDKVADVPVQSQA